MIHEQCVMCEYVSACKLKELFYKISEELDDYLADCHAEASDIFFLDCGKQIPCRLPEVMS